MIDTVIVTAKAPVAGQVKTRLCPPLRPHDAARLAAVFLEETLAQVTSWPATRRVLYLDGPAEAVRGLDDGWEIWPQPGGGLDERLAAALTRAAAETLLIGMDTPTLSFADVRAVFAPDAWEATDCYLGPSWDGGFWSLAMARPDGTPLLGVPMSTSRTGALTLRRLRRAGLRTRELRRLRDIDTAADADAVADAHPDQASSREWRRLRPDSRVDGALDGPLDGVKSAES
ncbi:MAG: TIGR04282 family arsenosugar biosynthesis glycosyltransferase [Mycobacteriales bacterium]